MLRRRAGHGHGARTALSAPPDLEPGERVRALAHASFRGAWASTMRTTFSFAAARKRMVDFEVWAAGVRAAGFSPEDPEMVLGVTDRRLIAWRKSFFRGRPTEFSTSLPIEELYDVIVVRHGLLTGVTFVTTLGGIVEVEALRGRRLRHLAHEAGRNVRP